MCVERSCYAVDIQPIAARVYEVSVHYADVEDAGSAAGQEAAGEGIVLRVALVIEPGLALRTVVEPVRPRCATVSDQGKRQWRVRITRRRDRQWEMGRRWRGRTSAWDCAPHSGQPTAE